MPVVTMYTLALNALLWVSRLAVGPAAAGAPAWLRWSLVMLAPCALFAAGLRVFPSRRPALATVTAVSVGLVGMLA